MRSVRLRVGSNLSICVMEIGWHDRRGQHGCMLGRTCLYAPWRLGGMTDEVSTVACWIGCVNMHQYENTNC